MEYETPLDAAMNAAHKELRKLVYDWQHFLNAVECRYLCINFAIICCRKTEVHTHIMILYLLIR